MPLVLFTVIAAPVPSQPAVVVFVVRSGPDIFVMVSVLTLDEPPKKFTVIGFIVPEPPLILSNLFPVIVLVGEPPSVLLIPVKPVAPVTVILVILLFLRTIFFDIKVVHFITIFFILTFS